MIGIIDYGLGNIKAFENIYHKLNIPVKRLRHAEDFTDITHLILPGVGAFDHAMQSFNDSGMREATESFVLIKKIPVIGICVGMQMLAKCSEEGVLPGLSWIDGLVKKFDENKIKDNTHLPHMGWNDVEVNTANPLFRGFLSVAKFYFLHSYYFEPLQEKDSIATSVYGVNFTCAVNKENIFGVQFHPEKSHEFGIRLLENFSKI